MTNKYLALLICSIILVSCCKLETHHYTSDILDKVHTSSKVGMCIKAGTKEVPVYIPTSGGTCAGATELIPEKWEFVFDDGNYEVSKDVYDLYSVGDKFTREEQVCSNDN